VTDESDYTTPIRGEQRGLHHVAAEVRQDLIADNMGQRAWGVRPARLLRRRTANSWQPRRRCQKRAAQAILTEVMDVLYNKKVMEMESSTNRH
jgi:predicted N-formylglutamate amidohydrolase